MCKHTTLDVQYHTSLDNYDNDLPCANTLYWMSNTILHLITETTTCHVQTHYTGCPIPYFTWQLRQRPAMCKHTILDVQCHTSLDNYDNDLPCANTLYWMSNTILHLITKTMTCHVHTILDVQHHTSLDNYDNDLPCANTLYWMSNTILHLITKTTTCPVQTHYTGCPIPYFIW